MLLEYTELVLYFLSLQVQMSSVPRGLGEGDPVLLHTVRQAVRQHGEAGALPEVGQELPLLHHTAALQVWQRLEKSLETEYCG